MNKLKHILLLAVMCLLLSLPTICAAQEIMPISEVKTGMRGIARTVVIGNTIEEFNVEILGVMPKKSATGGSLILVKTSGSVIERTGGIASGMSGSPVYINGKLVGAIAYGWGFADPTVGMVTPIEDMLKMFDSMQLTQDKKTKKAQERASMLQSLTESLLTTAAEKVRAVADAEKSTAEDTDKNADKDTPRNTENSKAPAKKPSDNTSTTTEANKNDKDIALDVNADTKAVKSQQIDTLMAHIAKTTPLMASGFTPRGLEFLKEKLQVHNLTAYEVGQMPTMQDNSPIQGGSSVSVDFIRGDMTLGAIGTVTYTEGDKLLAFGHPFLKLGNVDYFLSRAWMLTTVKSLQSPFKVGVTTTPLGSIKQDRGNGVAGKFGLSPRVIPVVITVTDQDSGISHKFGIQIINNEILSRVLLESSVFNMVDRIIDRTGEGSATVSFNIIADNLPAGRQVERKNMFYSRQNIATVITDEIYAAMSMLADNIFSEVNINHVGVEIEITQACKLAKITGAQALKTKVQAGESIPLEVTYLPFRGTPSKTVLTYTIPKSQQPGPITLMVRGGASIAWIQALIKQQQKDSGFLQREIDKNKSFVQIIDEFNTQDSNQDIIVDIMPNFWTKNSSKKTPKAEDKETPNPMEMFNPMASLSGNKTFSSILFGSQFKKTVPTDYLVNGDAIIALEVVESK